MNGSILPNNLSGIAVSLTTCVYVLTCKLRGMEQIRGLQITNHGPNTTLYLFLYGPWVPLKQADWPIFFLCSQCLLPWHLYPTPAWCQGGHHSVHWGHCWWGTILNLKVNLCLRERFHVQLNCPNWESQSLWEEGVGRLPGSVITGAETPWPPPWPHPQHTNYFPSPDDLLQRMSPADDN